MPPPRNSDPSTAVRPRQANFHSVSKNHWRRCMKRPFGARKPARQLFSPTDKILAKELLNTDPHDTAKLAHSEADQRSNTRRVALCYLGNFGRRLLAASNTTSIEPATTAGDHKFTYIAIFDAGFAAPLDDGHCDADDAQKFFNTRLRSKRLGCESGLIAHEVWHVRNEGGFTQGDYQLWRAVVDFPSSVSPGQIAEAIRDAGASRFLVREP